MRALRSLILGVVVLAVSPGISTGAETGRIEGRVVNETTGEPQPSVRVILSIGEPGSDEAEIVETRTDRKGRFVFRSLATGPDLIYAIDAFYDGGMFSGGALTLPDDTDRAPVVTSKLRVWDTTTDPSTLFIKRDDIFLSSNNEGGIGAIESVTLINTADEAYIGRGGDDPGAEPGRVETVGFALPGRADNTAVSIVDADIDVPALISTEYGFALTTALPPGETRFTFAYPVSGITGSFDISRRALYPILELSVFAAPPLEIESNRLSSVGSEDVGGRDYSRYSIDDALDAGDSIQVVAVADAGSVPTSLLLGMGGVLALVVVLGSIPFIRARRREPPKASSREELVRAIAELDIEHEQTDLSTEEWARRRAELKAELSALDGKGESR